MINEERFILKIEEDEENELLDFYRYTLLAKGAATWIRNGMREVWFKDKNSMQAAIITLVKQNINFEIIKCLN